MRSGRYLNVAYAPHLVMEYVHISQLQWYVHKVFHRYFSYMAKAGSRVDEVWLWVLKPEGTIDEERGDTPEVDLEPELAPPAASVGLHLAIYLRSDPSQPLYYPIRASTRLKLPDTSFAATWPALRTNKILQI